MAVFCTVARMPVKLDRDDYCARNAGLAFQGYNLLNNMITLENVMLSTRAAG